MSSEEVDKNDQIPEPLKENFTKITKEVKEMFSFSIHPQLSSFKIVAKAKREAESMANSNAQNSENLDSKSDCSDLAIQIIQTQKSVSHFSEH